MINELWNSTDKTLWTKALDSYFSSGLIKKDNMALEREIDKLNPVIIKDVSTEEFYDWLYNVYFVWKYTAANRLATTRKSLSRYKNENRMQELEQIHFDLFTFDVNDVKEGLRIASSIHGLGIAGASGLLAVLYPHYFGTVDQFVVKALCEIDNLPESGFIKKINPDNLTIQDAVLLIKIMNYKAAELNNIFNTSKWMPRDIDKILWAVRNFKVNTDGFSNNIQDTPEPKMHNKEFSNDVIENLKYNFEKYLKTKNRKEERIKEDLSWAFVHYRHNIGIGFWESFRSEETMNECYESLYEILSNGGFTGRGVANSKSDASAYMASVRRLKDFLDEKYGGVENYLKMKEK